jgi:DNA mismatch repair ATPase MutS
MEFMDDEAGDGERDLVKDIRPLSFEHSLRIDAHSMRSLGIFKDDTHPSVQRLGKTKEGFSLFSLLDQSASVGGKNTLR